MSSFIEADDKGVTLHTPSLNSHKVQVKSFFLAAFAKYKYLVKPGEKLTGAEWAKRIEDVRSNRREFLPITRSIITTIKTVMGE